MTESQQQMWCDLDAILSFISAIHDEYKTVPNTAAETIFAVKTIHCRLLAIYEQYSQHKCVLSAMADVSDLKNALMYVNSVQLGLFELSPLFLSEITKSLQRFISQIQVN